MAYQYLGEYGNTSVCLKAIGLILTSTGFYDEHGRDLLPSAVTLVTRAQGLLKDTPQHAFVFWDWILACTVVPSGFTSGYPGEGPRGLAYALLMVQAKNIPLYALEINGGMFDRLNQNRLTESDLHDLQKNGRSRTYYPHQYIDTTLSDTNPIKNYALSDPYLSYLINGAPPRIGWEWLDSEIATKCEELARTDLRSALARSFLILKERMAKEFEVPSSFDGEVLVNKVFGAEGILASHEADDAKKKELLAMRDLLVGLFKVFRNKYSHHDVFVPWYEAQVVLSTINFALITLGLLESNARRRAYRDGPGFLR
jgi:hypothetical protein